MPHCPNCGTHLRRTHRTLAQKLVCSKVFRCTKCGHHVHRKRPAFSGPLMFVFSRYTHCINCHTAAVHRLAKRDRVDSVSTSLMSRILGLLGAPLNKCVACRLQYYDWRPPAPANLTDDRRKPVSPITPRTGTTSGFGPPAAETRSR
jgi:hypothetical protein